MNVKKLEGQTVGLAASGGLDSCTITKWLSENGVKVLSITVDLGQPDERDLSAVQKRLMAAGATEAVVVDAREALAEEALSVIQAQATYEGRYWNTTAIARYVTTRALLQEIKSRGIGVLAHGATGRGNDQVRFQLAVNMMAPDVVVYAPWRDEQFLNVFKGRKQMIEFCNAANLPITASIEAPYSTDANMLGLTHEAGQLESLRTPASFIKPGMGCHAESAPDKAETVAIEFKAGRLHRINGRAVSMQQGILIANQLAGRNGIGIGIHLVENRFVGIKSRGVYESPGMELLGGAYAVLAQLVLDKRALDIFETLSRYLGKQIYQGYWLDLGTQAALSAVKVMAAKVTGVVQLSLYKGGVKFVSADNVTSSLYVEDEASMENAGSYDHKDAEGFLNVLGVSARILAAKGISRTMEEYGGLEQHPALRTGTDN